MLLVIQLVKIICVFFRNNQYHWYLFIGGENLSVTKGVVSRVCLSTYSHSLEDLLKIQIDAAINSGNSGGPAIQGI